MTESSPLPENEAVSTIGKRVDRLDRMLQNQQFLVEALIKTILNHFPNDENNSIQKDVENLSKRYHDINQEILSDTSRFSASDTIESQTHNLFKTIEAEIQQIKEENNQINGSEHQLEFENLKTEIEGLQKQMEALTGTETDKSSKTSFSILKSALTTKVEKMKNSIKSYESKTNKEISSLREMIGVLETTNRSYQAEFRNLNSRIQSYQLKFNYIQDQILTSEERDQMMNEIKAMKKQINSLKHSANEIDDLSNKIEVIKTKQSEIPIIKATQEKATQDIEEIREQINQLKEMSKVKSRNIDLTDILENYQDDNYDPSEEDINEQNEEEIYKQIEEEDVHEQNEEEIQAENEEDIHEQKEEEDIHEQNEEDIHEHKEEEEIHAENEEDIHEHNEEEEVHAENEEEIHEQVEEEIREQNEEEEIHAENEEGNHEQKEEEEIHEHNEEEMTNEKEAQNDQNEKDANENHEEDHENQHEEDKITQNEENIETHNEETNNQIEPQNDEVQNENSEIASLKEDVESLKSSQSNLTEQVNQILSQLSHFTNEVPNQQSPEEDKTKEKPLDDSHDLEERIQQLEERIEKLEQNTNEPPIRTRAVHINNDEDMNEIEGISRSFESLKVRVQKLEATLSTTNDSFNTLRIAATTAKDIVTQKSAKVDELEGIVKELKGSKDDALSEEMKSLMNAIRREVQQIEDQIAKIKSSADEASEGTLKSQSKINKLQRQIAEIKESNERNNKEIKELSEQLEKGASDDLYQKLEGLDSLYQMMCTHQSTLIENNKNLGQHLTDLQNLMNENKARIGRLESDLDLIQGDVSSFNKSEPIEIEQPIDEKTQRDISCIKYESKKLKEFNQKAAHDLHCLKYELKRSKHDLQCIKYELKKLKNQEIEPQIIQTPKKENLSEISEPSIDVLPMSPYRDSDDIPKKLSKLYVELDHLKKNILSWPSSIQDLQSQIDSIQEQVNSIPK